MFSATFDDATTIRDEAELRARLGTDQIYLASDGAVTLSGTVTVGPNVSFAGACVIGAGAVIETGSVLTSVTLGGDNRVRAYSVLSDLVAGDGNLFGPFCFIRDQCEVGDRSILGAHVETARSRFGSGVKISHRAFVGDADIGADTIIGAGAVFCNFDGQGRQSTRVGARTAIGSGVLLVAPLTIEDDVTIGAGSVVTKDLAAGARLIQKR